MTETKKKFKKVLIANRGEIAVRVARTLREMGISPVAVYSDADRSAPHVLVADEAYHVGPAPSSESYLVADRILQVAKDANVDAIHPGYGFLSENGAFANACAEAGITFIGPSAEAMKVMGSKTAARDKMVAAGVPCVPGSDGAIESEEEGLKVAAQMGYPIMLKAAAGGGGKGMRLVPDAESLPGAFRAASSEARNSFGDDTVYIEKAVIEPRHIEIQVLSGPDGKAIWLGERECSMQRRHQKIIEETPSLLVTDEVREKMGEVACRAADAVDYVGAGTVEFLMDKDRNFYFLEMNTRLQVEHPVTELCCGIDLVRAQITVAQGEPLPWKQEDIVRRGHAMEARIYAEDPNQNFMPCPGMIDELVFPNWPGLRVDCGVRSGYEVSRYYDPMIAKVVVWGEDREQARLRLRQALTETAVKGITTNTAFLRDLLDFEPFVSGDYHTGSCAAALEQEKPEVGVDLQDMAIAAAAIQTLLRDQKKSRESSKDSGKGSGSRWRTMDWRRGGV
jgi:acetyl-CoA carboxylase biotin carboxylase subunit